MCMGGGGRATIAVPKYSAYDSMANQQMELMKQQQTGMLTVKQQELQQSLQNQQATLSQLRDSQVQRANDTAANAARLSAILGPPPPEASAKAPEVGQNRVGSKSRQNKEALRIDRTVTPTASGAGLNIT